MSKISTDKIDKEMDKGTVDDQIVVFHYLKDRLTAKIVEAAKKHEDEVNKYLQIKDQINKK